MFQDFDLKQSTTLRIYIDALCVSWLTEEPVRTYIGNCIGCDLIDRTAFQDLKW
jgi:hypothetical protein